MSKQSKLYSYPSSGSSNKPTEATSLRVVINSEDWTYENDSWVYVINNTMFHAQGYFYYTEPFDFLTIEDLGKWDIQGEVFGEGTAGIFLFDPGHYWVPSGMELLITSSKVSGLEELVSVISFNKFSYIASSIVDSEGQFHLYDDLSAEIIISSEASNTPENIIWNNGSGDVIGTLSPSDPRKGTFFLVPTSTTGTAAEGEYQRALTGNYIVYITYYSGSDYFWIRISPTKTDTLHAHTVTPASSNLKATASGVTVSGNGSVEAVTAIGDSTVAGTLGVDATFNTNVILDSTSIKATASGTTVGASGTDTFVRSYPGAISKLTTASITPCDPNNTVTALTNDTTFTAATFEPTVYSNGVLAFNFTGGTLTKNTSTVAVKGVAATVATGALSDSSATINVGASVMTGLGTANTANAVTGVIVTAQPTVAIAAGTGTGAYNVVTGLNSASTTVNNNARVNAVTAIGTLTKNTVLTGVTVTNQPIVTLELNAAAGNGVVSVAVPTQVNTSTN